MKFRNKNLLITGGSGFIGSNFIRFILEKYDNINVYNVDKLTYAGTVENTKEFIENSNYRFIEADICDITTISKLFLEFDIDGVINFAAESHVDNSISNPELFIKTNVNGVFNLLSIAYKSWHIGPFKLKDQFKHARFHQVSTDEVFGSIAEGSFKETDPYRPNSPYASSKASADLLVRSFNKTYGLNTTVSYSSNNFGKNQNKEKFIPTIISCLKNGKEIPVYGDGKNIRDWIFVEDNCKAIELIFSNAASGSAYNIGANNELTNLELIELIFLELNLNQNIKKKINFIQDRFGHDKRYSLNTKKIKKDLGWNPVYTFETAIKKYLKNQL